MPTIEQARTWYPASDPVHGFDHILRVFNLAERLAREEGADIEIVRAAALLHDANSTLPLKNPEAGRHEHHHVSAEFARQVLETENWPEERIAAVQHCIRAHRFRDSTEQPQTLEAQVLFDADKMDAIGAIGVARAIAYAAQSGQPVYTPPSEKFLKTGEKEPGEKHSAYHEYVFKLCKLKNRLYTATARRLADERHCFMVIFFDHLIKEIDGKQ